MDPKKEAFRLVKRFEFKNGGMATDHAIECSKVVSEEIMDEHMFNDSAYGTRRYKYWKSVKDHIEDMLII